MSAVIKRKWILDFFSFWWLLGFWLRASFLLGKPFFAFVIFQIGSYVFALGPASHHNPPTYAYHVAGVTGMHHHSWLVCWDGISLFAWAGLDPLDLCLQNTWDYRHESLHLAVDFNIVLYFVIWLLITQLYSLCEKKSLSYHPIICAFFYV
jgi:hypothetical protein